MQLEGVGCLASISYKTYFDSEEVRVCYASQHSHPVGPANLPFTRRGRKAAALQEKERNRNRAVSSTNDEAPPPVAPAHSVADTETNDPDQDATTSATVQPQPPTRPPSSTAAFAPPIAIMTPQAQNTLQPPPSPFVYSVAAPTQSFIPPQNLSHDRWENMATLFQSIRESARTFEYPNASVALLESTLIRLYLESPLNFGPQPSASAVTQHLAMQARAQATRGEGNSPGTGGG